MTQKRITSSTVEVVISISASDGAVRVRVQVERAVPNNLVNIVGIIDELESSL